MAKKKRKPGRPASPRKKRPAAPAVDLSIVPDRRLLEGHMRQMVHSLQGGHDPSSPPAQAQHLLDQAFETPSEPRRVQLAREALAIWPDCADAYVLLAEHAPRRKEALDLYTKGVAAGERALGPEAFQRDAGHFWGILETRPYMRARLGLAHSLWVNGRRPEAVQHLQEMLRLNPGDNQGIRYTLAGFLLFLDRDDDLAQLLRQYPDEGLAAWAYTKALLAFRRQGDSAEARQLLKEAIKSNRHVPAYLTGQKYPGVDQPDYYSPGRESEALEYIAGFLASWRGTAGAIAWLRANDTTSRKRKPPAREPKGPLSLVKNWLEKHLPQREEVWQADVHPLSIWVDTAEGKVRPWAILVADRDSHLVLAHDIQEKEPTAAGLWDTIAHAMQHPLTVEPHRPTELQVRPGGPWESLRPHFEEIGIRLVETEDMEGMQGLFDEVNDHLGGRREAGLLDVPGMTPEQVGSCWEAAAAFYRQAPWKQIGYEAAIRVESAKFQSGPWYAVLMGQSGLSTGMAVYEDLDLLKRMWSDQGSDEDHGRQTVATTVTFGEQWELPAADLDAAKRYGWTVARPDVYPDVFHKERGLTRRPPLTWELELVEACLRAVPEFVRRRPQDDPTPEELTVPVASGPLQVRLSWVVE